MYIVVTNDSDRLPSPAADYAHIRLLRPLREGVYMCPAGPVNSFTACSDNADVLVTAANYSSLLYAQYAVELINKGLAYMDDTPQEMMQAQRMAREESYRRNTSPKENLEVSTTIA